MEGKEQSADQVPFPRTTKGNECVHETVMSTHGLLSVYTHSRKAFSKRAGGGGGNQYVKKKSSHVSTPPEIAVK
jgi:hypothetical protein